MRAAAETVLIRKMRQGGVARSPLPDTGLIGEAFARHAEDRLRPLVKSPISAAVHECRVTRLGEAASEIASPSMLGLLAVEEAETRALLGIDAALTWHLTDLVLGGDGAESSEPQPRAFTAIDMAVCRLHLDALVVAFGEAIATCLGRPLPRDLAIVDQRHTVSQIRIAPDYVDVLKIRLDVTLGEAGRSGRLDLILPLATLDVIRATVAQEGAASARERPNDLWRASMRRAAATAPVNLYAVLHRERMTLAAIDRLEPGQVIEIPGDAPREVQLTLDQPGGRTAVIAHARLGGYQGRKVVKLRFAPDPRVAFHVTRALTPREPEPPAIEAADAPRLPAPDEPAEDRTQDRPPDAAEAATPTS